MRIPAVLLAIAACSARLDGDPPDPPAIDAQQEQAPPENQPPSGATAPTVHVETITTEHRAVPGAMFGGWGPHLGHLLHTNDTTYWLDDLCSPSTAGDCNVNIDRRLGVFARTATGGWDKLATISLASFNVQENMAALAQGGRLYAYGIDTPNQHVVECRFNLLTHATGCSEIPLAIGAGANYVGAAVTPEGYRVVWWTNVVDGGGGSFGYLVNYGGGWNGPRTYNIGGYNACAYAHMTFDGTNDQLFCQVVSGTAPAWSFSTLVARTPKNLANVVYWANGLAPPTGDAIMSTDDLVADAAGTSHLIARSTHGGAVFYDRPSSGGYGPARLVMPDVYRARWVISDSAVALAHDTAAQTQLVIARAPAGSAFTPETWKELAVPLPADFGKIYAIYPVARAYQDSPLPTTELAVVGSGNEHRILYVSVTD